MLQVQQEFQNRAKEIDLYFDFVAAFLAGSCTLDAKFTTEKLEKLGKTLKANGYLLLYNLLESTASNAIEAVYDQLRTEGVRFNDCRDELQGIVLTNLRRHSPEKIQPKLADITIHIISETFKKEELFSGNVDAKKLRETADSYGFTLPRPRMDTSQLLTVKTRRNELAHGQRSFADVGRDCSIDDLQAANRQVQHYLDLMLNRVGKYISDKEYLRQTSAP